MEGLNAPGSEVESHLIVKRLQHILGLTALALAVLLALPGSSSAQIKLPVGPQPSSSATPTSNPTPLPTTDPTTDPDPDPAPAPTSTSTTKPRTKPRSGGSTSGGGSTTTRPRSTTTTRSSGGTTTTRSSGAPGGSYAGGAPMSAGAVADAIDAWRNRPKSPAHTSTRLLELIADAAGTPEPPVRAVIRGFGRFPVAGYVWYQDDYGAPRYDPYYHPHEGTDVFAEVGTPVLAASDGFIWKFRATLIGGNAIWLADGKGGYYYYGHMSRFAKGLRTGLRVKVGQVIGYVGATGSAVGTPPHCHFEIHPTGDPEKSVNPKPFLDAWLQQNEARMLAQLGYLPVADATSPIAAARWPELFEAFARPAAPPPALWAAGFGTGGTLAAADLVLGDLLAGEDLGALSPESGADGDVTISGDSMSLFVASLAAK